MNLRIPAEHRYFKEVLGIESILLPDHVSAEEVLHSSTSEESWIWKGDANTPVVCLESCEEGPSMQASDEILQKMMKAISVFTYWQGHLKGTAPPDTQPFLGNYGVVFGERVFDSLGSHHIYGAVLGKLIQYNGLHFLVTRGIEEIYTAPDPQHVKAEIWNHLKCLREVMRAKY